MPDFSKKIVYLSQAQYQELITNESITVDGVTVTYNDNDIYVTPQAEPVIDVKINGTSVTTNGVANVPIAGNVEPGVVCLAQEFGINKNISNRLYIYRSETNQIKAGSDLYRPIVPAEQHKSVFYGLTKAAGADMKDIANTTVGTYPDAQKAAIQNMLGITDLISTEEASTATAAHAINSTFMMNGKLHRATAAIAIGDAVEVGTNCEVVKADEVFIKKTDMAGTNIAGLVKMGGADNGIVYNGDLQLRIYSAASGTIKEGTHAYRPITPSKQHEAIYYGLSKLVGVDLANETVTVGTYPETSKTAIRSLIGAAAASDIPSVPVQDVQINGTSVLNNGIANIPIASQSTAGVIKVIDNNTSSFQIDSGFLLLRPATDAVIKSGTNSSLAPIIPASQHISVFYGLAKVAGADEKNSTLSAGTYTETAKSAIRTMLGAASPNVIAVQDEQPTNADTKVWLPDTEPEGIEVPTYAEFTQLSTNLSTNYVQKTDYASTSAVGIVQIQDAGGLIINNTTHRVYIDKATSNNIKSGTDLYRPIVSSNQHEAVFYGLATAAGDTSQASSDNTVGTYTTTASAAIRSMLGAVGDIQVNGTSVVSNGVANIPVASSNVLGVVSVGGANTGIRLYDNQLYIYNANDNEIKAGSSVYKPLTAGYQHASVFYGLAKAAGDSTQSASSNTVGTYTAEAKAAIHTMLGIDPASIAAQVDIPLVETISGTTPSITGQPNVRYVCGEVSTISITPPTSGSVDVIFESGSTAAVLTVPNTVKWPAWFDATTLETNTTYELLITDGVYGSVMIWAT